VGGTEHAVGHLLYSRMWTKALYDLGHIGFDEPFKKLLNQGMITGSSRFMYKVIPRIEPKDDSVEHSGAEYLAAMVGFIFISKDKAESVGKGNEEFLKELDSKAFYSNAWREEFKLVGYEIIENAQRIPVEFVDGLEVNIEEVKSWRPEFMKHAIYLYETNGKFIAGSEVEKMSKSKFNTVNPDDLVAKYGADTFRMYEMFLGPVEISKPWDTKGIEGVHRFLKKLWRLYFDELKGLVVTEEAPTADELKVLHKTIKKIEDDTERFSFNTAVSAFMVCVNELSDLKCRKKAILEPLAIMLTPYAPHIAAELYEALGHHTSVLDAAYPVFNASHVVESTKEYPVSINGKLRTTLLLPAEATQDEAQAAALANEVVVKWLEGKPVKKFIFVKGRMINVVV
jgi:leucyl-tRNA synthetase